MRSLFLASTSWLENVCYLAKEIINAKIVYDRKTVKTVKLRKRSIIFFSSKKSQLKQYFSYNMAVSFIGGGCTSSVYRVRVMVFNATFNNISVTRWW